MSAPLAADDPHPDRPAPQQRRLPYGLITASVLAGTILAIALVVALSSDDGSESADAGGAGAPIAGDGNSLVQPDLSNEPFPSTPLETFDGEPGAVADFAGGPMVVNLFASWCTPCIEEMPDFEAVHQQLGDEVTFVGINSTDRLDDAVGIVESTGVTYELLRDPNGDLLAELGGVGMPVTVFVDADGTIVDMRARKLDPDELRDLIRDELGVEP